MRTKSIPQMEKMFSDLIASKAWAKMSLDASALAPVLLVFSDPHGNREIPTEETMLEKSGIKTKAALRKALAELVALGYVEQGEKQ